jgi:hypothetical protein
MPDFPIATGYTRVAVPNLDKIRAIRSTCKFCGFVIEGSVSDGLIESERDHLTACKQFLESMRDREDGDPAPSS